MTIRADYDRHADVLYVALDEPRPAISEEGRDGLIYRFAMDDDRPCGVTVLGFKDTWFGRERDLAERIGTFLKSEAECVQQAIQHEIRELST